jgi:hypothetical protein
MFFEKAYLKQNATFINKGPVRKKLYLIALMIRKNEYLFKYCSGEPG